MQKASVCSLIKKTIITFEISTFSETTKKSKLICFLCFFLEYICDCGLWCGSGFQFIVPLIDFNWRQIGERKKSSIIQLSLIKDKIEMIFLHFVWILAPSSAQYIQHTS